MCPVCLVHPSGRPPCLPPCRPASTCPSAAAPTPHTSHHARPPIPIPMPILYCTILARPTRKGLSPGWLAGTQRYYFFSPDAERLTSLSTHTTPHTTAHHHGTSTTPILAGFPSAPFHLPHTINLPARPSFLLLALSPRSPSAISVFFTLSPRPHSSVIASRLNSTRLDHINPHVSWPRRTSLLVPYLPALLLLPGAMTPRARPIA